MRSRRSHLRGAPRLEHRSGAGSGHGAEAWRPRATGRRPATHGAKARCRGSLGPIWTLGLTAPRTTGRDVMRDARPGDGWSSRSNPELPGEDVIGDSALRSPEADWLARHPARYTRTSGWPEKASVREEADRFDLRDRLGWLLRNHCEAHGPLASYAYGSFALEIHGGAVP